MPDIGARRTRLATSMSPIFSGLGYRVAEPVTDFSFFWRALHRAHFDPF
jgi:hypothetical protein